MPSVSRLVGWAGRILAYFDGVTGRFESSTPSTKTEKSRLSRRPQEHSVARASTSDESRWDVEVETMSCDPKVVSRYVKTKRCRKCKNEKPPVCVILLTTLNHGPDALLGDLDRMGWKPLIARDDGEPLPVSFLGYDGPEVAKGKRGVDMIPANGQARVVFGFGPEAFEKGLRPILLVMNPFMASKTVFLALPDVKGPAITDGGVAAK